MDLLTDHRQCVKYLRARFGDTERGANLVEYALLVVFIAMACILAVTFFGARTSEKYSGIASAVGAG